MTIPLQLAQIALRPGDPDEAIDRLETTRPFERRYVRTIAVRGQALLAKGEPDKAVVEFERVIGMASFPFPPAKPVAYLWLGRAHRDNGDPEAARAAYEKFFEEMAAADEGIPVIEKARAEYATIPGAQG